MSLSPLHTVDIIESLENFVAMIRPKDEAIRKKLDYGYRIDGQSITLHEIRPQWDNPEVIREHAFAKATYIKASDRWKIYWLRSNLKWYLYEPSPTAKNIQNFLSIVKADEHHCFFG